LSQVSRPKLASPLSLAAWFVLAAAGCRGPEIRLDNPERHTCYLDGQRESRGVVPFRFYGQSRLDTVPADLPGHPDWHHVPTRQALVLEPPASPWLFPLDFLVEVVSRTFAGPGDLATVVAVAEDPARPIDPAYPPSNLGDLNRRARAARAER
jgi:hypothetical protein